MTLFAGGLQKIHITIVIPCYNESKRIIKSMKELRTMTERFPDVEIIFVDDGSKDDTYKILVKNMWDAVRILSQGNKGKWGALKAGYKMARGDYVIFLDADLSVGPGVLINVLADKGKHDIICGNRYKMSKAPLRRRIPSKIFNYLFVGLFGLRGVDSQCPVKILKRSKEMSNIINGMKEDGFTGDVEFFALAKKYGLNIKPIDVLYVYKDGEFNVAKNSIRMFKDLMRIWWLYK